MNQLGYEIGKITGTIAGILINLRWAILSIFIAAGVVGSIYLYSHFVTINAGNTAVDSRIGRSARVVFQEVNIRRTAGHERKGTGDVVGTVKFGEKLTVLGGPVQVDGRKWWYVRSARMTGWIAEYNSSTKLIDLPQP